MRAAGAILLASVTTLLLAAGLVGPEGETVAQGPLTLAVDADPTGNTATSVGNIDDCLSVDLGATFDVDIVIENVANLLGWESPFVYDKSILEVVDINVRLFQAANPNSNVINASESPPDRDGLFLIGAADVSKATDNGSGVLARLTLQAIGTGVSPASIPQVDFNNDGTPDLGPTLAALIFGAIEHLGDTNGDNLFDGPTDHARIAVGLPCTAATPTPTPTPTAVPGQTPEVGTPTPATAVLDADEDGVPDVSDQCPDDPAGASVDASGCSETQLEQLAEQVEEQLLEALTAGLNLDVSLDTVAVGGSTTVLAVFADENDEPVSGVDITFNIEEQPGSDADLDGEPEVTKASDAEGVAKATLNVGSTPGEIVVSATAEGQTETVTVTVAAVESAAEGPAAQTERTPEPDSPLADSTPGAAPAPMGGNTGDGSSDDGSGLPAWMVGVIIVAALALATGVLAAWRAVRDRSAIRRL
jgi:hypothetical protein